MFIKKVIFEALEGKVFKTNYSCVSSTNTWNVVNPTNNSQYYKSYSQYWEFVNLN